MTYLLPNEWPEVRHYRRLEMFVTLLRIAGAVIILCGFAWLMAAAAVGAIDAAFEVCQ